MKKMKYDMKISKYKIKKFIENSAKGIDSKPKKLSLKIKQQLKLEGY